MGAQLSARHVVPMLVVILALLSVGAWVARGEAGEQPTEKAEPLARAVAVPGADTLDVVTEDDDEPATESVTESVTDSVTDSEPGTPADGGGQPAPADVDAAFADRFPDHAAARQVEGEPETFHWAVIIGPDRYQGSTGNTLGSVADARVLTETLHARGWRGDHVLTLTDAAATGANIRRAFDWLAAKTDERSTVVVSFSGHMDHRGSGEGTTAALWTHDNQRIWPGELGNALGAVEADRMWLSFQGCHAAGLAAPGVEGERRLVTYSSRAAEKSYEDPEVGHSVMGNYLFREGLAQGWGNDGNTAGASVQGAFDWAAPRANTRTAGQQTPVISDRLGEPFTLEISGPPGDREASDRSTDGEGSRGLLQSL